MRAEGWLGALNRTRFGSGFFDGLGGGGGVKGVAEEVLAGAIELSHDAAHPFGEVFAKMLVGLRVQESVLKAGVAATQFNLEVHADLRDVKFHGIIHVHNTGGVAGVPDFVVILIAAGDEVGDGVFGVVGIDFGGLNDGVKAVVLAGDREDDGEGDIGQREAGLELSVLIELFKKFAHAGGDLQDGDGADIQTTKQGFCGEGAAVKNATRVVRSCVFEETKNLMRSTIFFQVTGAALSQRALASGGIVILDEDQLFHNFVRLPVYSMNY